LGTTTTTAPPSTSTTAASAPSGGDLTAGATQAPAGAKDAGGDGAVSPTKGITVPPGAQKIIDSVRRTPPNSNAHLLELLGQLEALGVAQPEAYRIGLGRFPIAGPARYSHDWLYPRYGPGFRFHLGCDIVAPYGTPVRAPVDGVVRSSTSGLGGLTAKVVMPDGTYFYMAHLSGLVEGFTDGMAVTTGDIVGYVGDSGNAKGGTPHLHFGIYPKGGAPIDPKPVLDKFLVEAEQILPQVVAAVQQAQVDAGAPAPVAPVVRPTPATPAQRFFTGDPRALPQEAIYALGANPQAGPEALVRLALNDLVAGIDWSARAKAPPGG
jgi:murein DD-endopeptidase MepM/ murein hydrolase activator NlpD